MCSVSSHLNTSNNIKPLWKGQVNEQPDRMRHELLNPSVTYTHTIIKIPMHPNLLPLLLIKHTTDLLLSLLNTPHHLLIPVLRNLPLRSSPNHISSFFHKPIHFAQLLIQSVHPPTPALNTRAFPIAVFQGPASNATTTPPSSMNPQGLPTLLRNRVRGGEPMLDHFHDLSAA